MSNDVNLILLASAIALLLAGHVVRAVRHALLFPVHDIATRHTLLLALSIAYALNAILPFRIGELCRAAFLGIRLRIRLPYVLSTVIIERLTDLAVVTAVFAILASFDRTFAPLLTATAVGTLSLGVVLWLVRSSQTFRRGLWTVASIFNHEIRRSIVETAWTSSRLAADRVFLGSRFVTATIAMWCCYFASYVVLAYSLQIDPLQIIGQMLGTPLRPLLEQLREGFSDLDARWIILFVNVPVVLVIGVGLVRQRREIERAFTFVRRFGLEKHGIERLPVVRRFRSPHDLEDFLATQFGANAQVDPEIVTTGLDNAVVVRMFVGGSDAVTGVVDNGGNLVIRKAAQREAGDRLRVQFKWIREHHDALPVTSAEGFTVAGQTAVYEMPFYLSARDFYEYIHTSPIAQSRQILGDVVDSMHRFHAAHRTSGTGSDMVGAYLETKVAHNARRIRNWMAAALDTDYSINGEAYSFREWDVLEDRDWLERQIQSTTSSAIHGDLTIENIIIHPEARSGWYLIDPNPENVFNSPLIDWAKLRQSLNLGYEQLNRMPGAVLVGDGLRVPMARSQSYAELNAEFNALLVSRLTDAEQREVAFHEIVNYLRLTPYKFGRDRSKGMTFFACTSLLLRRYRDAYDA